MGEAIRLPVDRLRRRCDPASLPFASTVELEPLEGTIGQPRATSAIDFGLDIRSAGYNLFVLGPTGTGKRTTLETELRRLAAGQPRPGDWVYLFDFGSERRAIALELPGGSAPRFAREMRRFVEDAVREIARSFESDEYQRRSRQLGAELDARREHTLAAFRQAATQLGLALEFTPAGVATAPLVDGKPVSAETFEALSEEQKAEYRTRSHAIEEQLPDVLAQMRNLEREGRARLRQLDREVALFAVGHLIDDLKARHQESPRLAGWLDQVREDIIDHLEFFRGTDGAAADQLPEPLAAERRGLREETLGRYEVNVFVTRGDVEGAPVVVETSPTYYNVFGRLEYRAVFGALTTGHRDIRCGAIHRANGGYLMLNAADLLASPFAWERLKETLRTGSARVENMGAQVTLFPTTTLDPEPIPVELKVILVGSPALYHLLYTADEEFRKLFKVRVEFDVEMPWDDRAPLLYARFVRGRVDVEGLRHMDREAIARLVEHGARLAEDQRRLTTRFAEIVDVVAEASYWAGVAQRSLVTAADVDRAITARQDRAGLVEERIRELIADGTLHVDTSTEVVGQVNGLAVVSVGGHSFGRPLRITASSGVGRGEVVSVDRETQLAGPIYSKGFMILAGYLQERYGHDRPLSLRTSLVIEQSYEEVEGDSASLAELVALLSSLGDVPIHQGIAVTGSVDQKGLVQPIGGVNEKIEGFFSVCRLQGFTGRQGVVVPATNAPNLMLGEEVLEAVREGRFSVWTVETVDEAVEILTGMPAGVRQDDGTYPEGSLHRRVDDRLAEIVRALREMEAQPGAGQAPDVSGPS